MEEYLIFLDETKPVKNQNPYFCLAGLIISKEEYMKKMLPLINSLKEKYFNTSSVIFHFTDMKKNKNNFTIFNNIDTRNAFWNEYIDILTSIEFTTIGIYFEQVTMTCFYAKPSYRSYDIAFISLLDNITHFLYHNKVLGQICIESRTLKENSYLLNSYCDYLNKGSLYHSKDTINEHLSGLGFIYKEENCIGLQIADMIPSIMLRKISKKKDNFGLKSIFYDKLYQKGSKAEDIIGFKRIL